MRWDNSQFTGVDVWPAGGWIGCPKKGVEFERLPRGIECVNSGGMAMASKRERRRILSCANVSRRGCVNPAASPHAGRASHNLIDRNMPLIVEGGIASLKR